MRNGTQEGRYLPPELVMMQAAEPQMQKERGPGAWEMKHRAWMQLSPGRGEVSRAETCSPDWRLEGVSSPKGPNPVGKREEFDTEKPPESFALPRGALKQTT